MKAAVPGGTIRTPAGGNKTQDGRLTGAAFIWEQIEHMEKC